MRHVVLASVSLAVFVGATALAQPVLPPLTATPISRTVLLSLDAVQAQDAAASKRGVESKSLIAGALLPLPLPLLTSTPLPRR